MAHSEPSRNPAAFARMLTRRIRVSVGSDIVATPSIAFTGGNSGRKLPTVSWMLSAGGALVLVATRRPAAPKSAKAGS